MHAAHPVLSGVVSTFTGGKGLDLLFDGQGNDTISGDFARATLMGGSENDLFLLRLQGVSTDVAVADSIADFQLGIDSIGLTGDLTFDNLRLKIYFYKYDFYEFKL